MEFSGSDYAKAVVSALNMEGRDRQSGIPSRFEMIGDMDASALFRLADQIEDQIQPAERPDMDDVVSAAGLELAQRVHARMFPHWAFAANTASWTRSK